MNKRQSMCNSMMKISHDELKVTLHDVTPPKTSSLMQNNIKTEIAETPKRNSLMKRTRSQTGFKNYSIDTRISTNTSTKADKPIPSMQIQRFLEKETLKSPIENANSRISQKQIEWDEEFEKKFKSYMSQGRKLFFNEMKNAKFNEVGLMYMMQELFKEEKKNLERAACLDKYGEGNYLTAEELKFLADTSDLMNSCVDKTYIKKVVNLIDPNVLHYVIFTFRRRNFHILIKSID